MENIIEQENYIGLLNVVYRIVEGIENRGEI